MKQFISEYKKVSYLFVLSVMIIFSYVFTNNMTELFIYAEELFSLAYQISLAYITGLIFFILVIYFPEKQKKERYRNIGFLQLTIPISHHVRLFQYMYKSTLNKKPEEEYHLPKQMINDTFIDSLHNFDFSSEAPTTPSEPWIVYIAQEFNKFQGDLKEVLFKYAYYFEDDEIEIIEEISNSFIMSVFKGRGDVRQFNGQVWNHIGDYIEELKTLGNQNRSLFMPDATGRDFLREYLNFLMKLINFHDQNTHKFITIDNKLWAESIAPMYNNKE